MRPPPRATQVSGSSATTTGRPVSSVRSLSMSRSSAPPPACEDDASLGHIRAEFRGSLFQRLFHGADDALQRFLQSFQDLIAVEREAARDALGEVAALHRQLAHLLTGVGRANLDLDAL